MNKKDSRKKKQREVEWYEKIKKIKKSRLTYVVTVTVDEMLLMRTSEMDLGG